MAASVKDKPVVKLLRNENLGEQEIYNLTTQFTVDILGLTFRRRIKSRLPFAGIIRSSSYSTRFQDKG